LGRLSFLHRRAAFCSSCEVGPGSLRLRARARLVLHNLDRFPISKELSTGRSIFDQLCFIHKRGEFSTSDDFPLFVMTSDYQWFYDMLPPPKDYSSCRPVIEVLDRKFPNRHWDPEVQNYLDGKPVSISSRLAIEREISRL
jgi:hypothetical protein